MTGVTSCTLPVRPPPPPSLAVLTTPQRVGHDGCCRVIQHAALRIACRAVAHANGPHKRAVAPGLAHAAQRWPTGWGGGAANPSGPSWKHRHVARRQERDGSPAAGRRRRGQPSSLARAGWGG